MKLPEGTVGELLPTASFKSSGLLSVVGAASVGVTFYQENRTYRIAKLSGTYEGVFVRLYSFSNNEAQFYSIFDILFSKSSSTIKATAKYYFNNGLQFNFYKDDTYLYIKCRFAGLVHFEVYAISQNQVDYTDVTSSIDTSSLTEITPTSYF